MLSKARVYVVDKNRIVIVVIFAIISFFILRYCAVVGVSVFETISSCCLYPVLRVQQLVIEPIMMRLSDRATMRELETIIENVQKKYDDIFAENIALKAMRCYADETAELRNFNKRYVLHGGHVVHILARHFSPHNQFFLVDAGSLQGIKKDMVALYCNAIVGRVAEVYPWYCKICLITDVGCKVAALCPRKCASGIHEGINDISHTAMRYVSHLETVIVGDDVLSSGEGLIFPKGFALGKVISADKSELFYTITIQPALNFQTLCYCTLIAKEDIER